MKIVSVKFLNLNSLKGKHEIRFDQPPFTESGLFAITGPTGAGKTTILDAITVALYGRVHRHSKDVFEIMTRHTAESYAEVEFEVKDKLYRAKWSIRRSRGKADGQLQTQKMELADALTGKIIIEHPLQEVREEIVKLCGLDYSQFLRSVMLSQGDFTRFLKADENERSELLEKITDTGIYSQISVAAYEKARQERLQLDLLRGKLNDVPLLTADERSVYTQKLAALAAQESIFRQQEAVIRQKLDWLINLERLEKKKIELKEDLTREELFFAAHEATFSKLRRHQQALTHRPALAEIKIIENQRSKTEADLKELRLLLPGYTTEEKETKAALIASREQTDLTEQQLNAYAPVFETVIKKDILIRQLQGQQEKAGKAFDTAQLGLNTANATQIALRTELDRIQQRISAIAQWLEENAGDAALDKEIIVFRQQLQQNSAIDLKINTLVASQLKYKKQKAEEEELIDQLAKKLIAEEKKLEAQRAEIKVLTFDLNSILADRLITDLESDLTGFPALISTAEQQIRLSNQYHKRREEQAASVKTLTRHKENLTATRQLVVDLQAEHDEAIVISGDYQKIYELEVKVQNYDDDRLQLRPEEPCPLCGATHHPYAEGKYTSRVSEAAERRNQQQEKLNLIKLSLDKQLMNLNSLIHQVETEGKTLAQIESDLLLTTEEFEANNLRLPKPLDIHKPKIIAAVVEKKKLQQQALQQDLKSVRALQLQISTMESAVHQQKEILVTEQNKMAQIQLSIAFADNQLGQIAEELEKAENERSVLYAAAVELLKPFNLVYDPSDTTLTIEAMAGRFGRYNQLTNEINSLQLELRQKETEIKNIAATISEKKDIREQLHVQLKKEQKELERMQEERFELFGLKDPEKERELLQTALTKYRAQAAALQLALQDRQEKLRIAEDRQAVLIKAIADSEKQHNQQVERLLASIETLGLKSVAELNSWFLREDEAQTIDNLRQESVQKIASGKSMAAATEKELNDEKIKQLTQELKEDLSQQLEEKDKELSGLLEDKGRVQELVHRDDRLKTRYHEFTQQIESQQKVFDRFQQLSALIGSADGKKFSRFAQGLTLARLTELANRHLSRLSDRYIILKSPEKDLELQIIDGYQADVVRPMSTLSGGESFLVSLALALGLSDLASRKVQINSLFIDEGFGTLDAETLDVAITALENLQANGKSIGIISHVEALKDRISTQIQVVKQSGGSSVITLYSYGHAVTL